MHITPKRRIFGGIAVVVVSGYQIKISLNGSISFHISSKSIIIFNRFNISNRLVTIVFRNIMYVQSVNN